jgi:hypothetical protein
MCVESTSTVPSVMYASINLRRIVRDIDHIMTQFVDLDGGRAIEPLEDTGRSSLLFDFPDTPIGGLGGSVPRFTRANQLLAPDDTERDAVRVRYCHPEAPSRAIQLSDR